MSSQPKPLIDGAAFLREMTVDLAKSVNAPSDLNATLVDLMRPEPNPLYLVPCTQGGEHYFVSVGGGERRCLDCDAEGDELTNDEITRMEEDAAHSRYESRS